MTNGPQKAGPARRPGTHYVSPFFDPAGFEREQLLLAPKLAVQPKKLTEAELRRKPGREGLVRRGAPSSIERATRQGKPVEVLIFCDAYRLRLACARALYCLWRMRGAVVRFEAFVAYGCLGHSRDLNHAVKHVIYETRQGTRRHFGIRNEQSLGYALSAEGVKALDALLQERLPPVGAGHE